MKRIPDRSVNLMCSTCGYDQFKFDDSIDESTREYQCLSCKSTFRHEELFHENGELINETFKSMEKDIEKELKRSLKRTLKGNKFIKFK